MACAIVVVLLFLFPMVLETGNWARGRADRMTHPAPLLVATLAGAEPLLA